MIQAGGDRDFAQKAFAGQRSREFGLEHLDRDLPVVLQVLGEIDRGHASRPELALDAVAAGEGGGETAGDSHDSVRGA